MKIALIGATGYAGGPIFKEAVEGHDVVISSVRFLDTDPRALINAVKKSHVPRYLVVGGAGSLEVAPGVSLVDTPEFPKTYQAEAKAGVKFLEELRQEKDLNWTFLSPSANFTSEGKTGKFRLGTDQLLVDAKGESRISVQDFAVAMLNEVERPQHRQKRFTVGY